MKILGIDVGGSGIKGGIVDTDAGQMITDRYRIPTPQPATPEAVIETIVKIIQHFKWQGPVGCGFPAAIVDDIVRTASNIDKSWIGINASKQIEDKTGCKTTLVNDVDAAGFAEMKLGAGKGQKGVVFMAAFGTGIGTAIFRDGTLITNTELGHILMDNGKIAENYAANSVREKKDLSWKKWGKRVNKYLQQIEKLLYPSLIIIGGGVSSDFDKFHKKIKTDAPVVPAKNQNHAGIIGAALAAELNEQ